MSKLPVVGLDDEILPETYTTSAVSILTVWEAKPSSTFVSVFTCEFAENTKVMQRTPTPDRLPGMHGQPLREIMFDSPSM
jgi:hypothetical protein